VFLPKKGVIAPFIYHFLKSVDFPDLGYSRHFRYLKNVLMPLPPLSEQHRIVAELDALHAKVEALKHLQTETAAELDALLPAILDCAFKGDL
jgi:type I restriction enzyme S subunit